MTPAQDQSILLGGGRLWLRQASCMIMQLTATTHEPGVSNHLFYLGSKHALYHLLAILFYLCSTPFQAVPFLPRDHPSPPPLVAQL